MPTNRRPLRRGLGPTLTRAAIEAWRAGDYRALHDALGLRPWEPSPLHIDRDRCPVLYTKWDEWDEKSWQLQQELYLTAGEPGRVADADES